MTAETQVDVRGEIRRAMDELGVPQEGYPVSVANAYHILEAIIDQPAAAELPDWLATRVEIYEQLLQRGLMLNDIEFLLSDAASSL